MSFPLAAAAQVGVPRTEIRVPTFTNFELDATTVKITDPTSPEEHMDATGGTATLGMSNPTLRISGSMMVTAKRRVTVTADATANTLATVAAHGLIAGDVVRFTTTSALPAPLTINTDYFVLSSGLTSTAFKVATVADGSAVDLSDTGTGTQTASIPFKPLPVKLSVIKCKDADTASPWFGLYFVFMKADPSALVAGRPAIFDVELGYFPKMQTHWAANNPTDIDA